MNQHIGPACAGTDPQTEAWLIRGRRRQERREAAIEAMRQCAGYRPSAAIAAAIAQRANRAEHSR